MLFAAPVSYTHLDVYKRQNIPLLKAHIGKSLAPGFCPLQHLRRVIQAGDLRLRHFPIEGHGQYAGTHGAVSYTHLLSQHGQTSRRYTLSSFQGLNQSLPTESKWEAPAQGMLLHHKASGIIHTAQADRFQGDNRRSALDISSVDSPRPAHGLSLIHI